MRPPWQLAHRLAEISERFIPPALAVRAMAALQRRWGEPELKLLPRLVPRDRIAIDVGAADGIYTHLLARLASEVHAFEPNPRSAEAVRRRVPRAAVHSCALSDGDGATELRIPIVDRIAYDGWATCEPENSFAAIPASEVQRLQVKRRTLDSYDFRRVGFIKIDVEGHEAAVLRGAIETLRRERPVLIVEAEDRHRPGAVRDLHNLLGDLGYRHLPLSATSNNYVFLPAREWAGTEHLSGIGRHPVGEAIRK